MTHSGYGFCGSTVHFISRYKSESDYCVLGQRITMLDDGSIRKLCDDPISAEERKALVFYLLTMYADYCRWHAQQKLTHGLDWPNLQPIEHLPSLVIA